MCLNSLKTLSTTLSLVCLHVCFGPDATLVFSFQHDSSAHRSYRGNYQIGFPKLHSEDLPVTSQSFYSNEMSIVESYAMGLAGEDSIESDEWRCSVGYECGCSVTAQDSKAVKANILKGKKILSESVLPTSKPAEQRSQFICESSGLQSAVLIVQCPGRRYVLELAEVKKDKKLKLGKADRDRFFTSFAILDVEGNSPSPPLDAIEQNRSDNALGINMIWVPSGNFKMGSPGEEVGHRPDETIADVQLSHGFWLASTETTQRQWIRLVGTTPFAPTMTQSIQVNRPMGDNLPVAYISRKSVLEFCGILTDLERSEGRISSEWCYTLPSEAQWEFACRAGSSSAYSFGNDPRQLTKYAWYADNASKNGQGSFMPVARKAKNALGLYDMHGNVSEYCLDQVDKSKTVPGGIDPIMTANSESIRGGNYLSNFQNCRSATRFPQPDKRNAVGFRIALVKSETLNDDRLLPLQRTSRKSAYEPQTKIQNIHHAAFEKDVHPNIRVEDSPLGVEMIWCPPGTFLMGSRVFESVDTNVDTLNVGDAGCQPTCLTKGFWISKSEVTNSIAARLEWVAASQNLDGNRPVYMRFREAVKACQDLTLSEQQAGRLPVGYEYRLPTEAEWEYACRASTTTNFFWGNDPRLAKDYHVVGTTSFSKTVVDVMTHKPNSWGIHDMIGNAPEWCLDRYKPYHQGGIDPFCSNGDFIRPVVRGLQSSARRSSGFAPVQLEEKDDSNFTKRKDYLFGVRVVLGRPIEVGLLDSVPRDVEVQFDVAEMTAAAVQQPISARAIHLMTDPEISRALGISSSVNNQLLELLAYARKKANDIVGEEPAANPQKESTKSLVNPNAYINALGGRQKQVNDAVEQILRQDFPTFVSQHLNIEQQNKLKSQWLKCTGPSAEQLKAMGYGEKNANYIAQHLRQLHDSARSAPSVQAREIDEALEKLLDADCLAAWRRIAEVHQPVKP